MVELCSICKHKGGGDGNIVSFDLETLQHVEWISTVDPSVPTYLRVTQTNYQTYSPDLVVEVQGRVRRPVPSNRTTTPSLHNAHLYATDQTGPKEEEDDLVRGSGPVHEEG